MPKLEHWRHGFAYPWFIGCGGDEVPFTREGKTYLYVWNMKERTHYYYSFSEDLFILDKDFVHEHTPKFI